MLILISKTLDTPVNTLLGESISSSTVDDLKTISKKLEVINSQLLQRKNNKRKIIHRLLILLCTILVLIFLILFFLNSIYLNWNYNESQYAILGVTLHSFEWLFVRIAPILLIGTIIGIILTRKNS